MAQRVQILLEDDIDGTPATETIPFALDGKSYEIDLNEKNAGKLRGALEKFIAASRKAGTNSKSNGTPRAQKVTPLGPSPREVRDWARSNGLEVPDRGRIPEEIRKQFEAAH